jgi:uncharacterized phage-associated protein
MPYWSQNAKKLRELILFVVDRCADEPVGDIYLNKVLFFSDAFALQHLGEPITGARYQKLAMGPAARALLPLRTEMIHDGDVEVEMVGKRRVTRALREPDTSVFSTQEVKLVERVMDLFRGYSATVVSNASHVLSPGWNLVDIGEDIPLQSQLLSTEPVSPEILARGRELAEKYGWSAAEIEVGTV